MKLTKSTPRRKKPVGGVSASGSYQTLPVTGPRLPALLSAQRAAGWTPVRLHVVGIADYRVVFIRTSLLAGSPQERSDPVQGTLSLFGRETGSQSPPDPFPGPLYETSDPSLEM